jgi:hypothetical protein
VFGSDILQEAGKQVCMVRENPRVAQSRQKSYTDHRKRELSFKVGDFVYLKVHWTIQDFGKERLSRLPIRVAAAVVRCP